MRTITTMRNGNIYQMDISEAIEIVEAYKRVNGHPGMLEAVMDMGDRVALDELPIKQKVAYRRFMRDMEQLFAPVDA